MTDFFDDVTDHCLGGSLRLVEFILIDARYFLARESNRRKSTWEVPYWQHAKTAVPIEENVLGIGG